SVLLSLRSSLSARHIVACLCFFFSSRRRHTRLVSDWSSDVCSSDLGVCTLAAPDAPCVRAPALLWTTGGRGWGGAGFLDGDHAKIGRASCRERVEISVGAG